jgi:ubiquinone/menaquinone biosynthesis C-methylase UbiE
MTKLTDSVQQHYSVRPILPLIREQLRRKGIDERHVRPADLYPYDQSHAGGADAVRMLAERVAIAPRSVVVEVGCGYGSAARWLHAERQCRVVGVDLTPSRIETAVELTRMVRFHSGVNFVVGSAMDLPIASSTADYAWTQHVTMNVPDHAALLRECARVLKPSGRLAGHEWLRRKQGELPFPLPWAYSPPLNHAIEEEKFFALLGENYFEAEAEDVTEAMRQALVADAARLEAQGHPPERTAALRNLVQAAGDGLFGCLMIVARKD